MVSEKKREMLKVGLIVLGASIVITLLSGILAAVQENWFKMSLSFFTAVYLVFCCMASVLAVKIEKSFKHLKNLIVQNTDDVLFKKDKITDVIGIISVILVAVTLSLGGISGLHNEFLKMGLYLITCASISIIFTGAALSLKVHKYTKQLDKLISEKREKDPLST